MKKMLEVGSAYEVHHKEKGTFVIVVRFTDRNFTTGMIVDGKVEAFEKENEKSSGDQVTVRNCFCEFKPMHITKGALL